jgi:tetratricopeptide (TPR) repeat protein
MRPRLLWLLGGALAACQPAPAPPASPPAASPPASVAAPCVWREVDRLLAEAESSRSLDVDRFLALSRQAAALAPQDASIAASIARGLARKEAWSEAANEARRAAELAPTRADLWELVASFSAQAAAGEEAAWKGAEEGARRCVALDPRRAECLLALGQARWQAGDEGGALSAFSEAARQAPDQIRYRLSQADLYVRIEEPDLALVALDDGLRLAPAGDPDRTRALVALGATLQEKGDLTRALAVLEGAKVADSGGRFPEILFLMGLVHAHSQPPRRQEAVQLLMAFRKRACKGALASRYASQCETTERTAQQLGNIQP